ncbi:MAG: hypothetical protein WA843_03620 [Candidatus Saccharimonadales bacterium]
MEIFEAVERSLSPTEELIREARQAFRPIHEVREPGVQYFGHLFSESSIITTNQRLISTYVGAIVREQDELAERAKNVLLENHNTANTLTTLLDEVGAHMKAERAFRNFRNHQKLMWEAKRLGKPLGSRILDGITLVLLPSRQS